MLIGGDGNDELRDYDDRNLFYGGNGNDRIFDGNGASTMWGGSGNDTIVAEGGADLLYGEAGDDYLNGGAGADRLYGGSGNDYMLGGTGADVFVFELGNGIDRIGDFELGLDRVEIASAAVGGMTDPAAVVAAYGVVGPGYVDLYFGSGELIRFLGLTSLDGLANDLVIV